MKRTPQRSGLAVAITTLLACQGAWAQQPESPGAQPPVPAQATIVQATIAQSGATAVQPAPQEAAQELVRMEEFAAEVRSGNKYTEQNPLLLKLDLEYFNSSSAKFLFDIFAQLKELQNDGIPVIVEWHYDEEDTDLREAGEDLALLCEMQFRYCPKV